MPCRLLHVFSKRFMSLLKRYRKTDIHTSLYPYKQQCNDQVFSFYEVISRKKSATLLTVSGIAIQSVAHGPIALASPGSLLELQNLGFLCHTEKECVFWQNALLIAVPSKLEKHWS